MPGQTHTLSLRLYSVSYTCMHSCYIRTDRHTRRYFSLCGFAPVTRYVTILTRCGSAQCSPLCTPYIRFFHDSSEMQGRPTREAVTRQCWIPLSGSHPVSNLQMPTPNEGYHQSFAAGRDTKSHSSVYHKRKLLMMMFFFKCTNIKSSEIYLCVCVCA